jgi:hypothetical protein
MRTLLLPTALIATSLLFGCGSSQQTKTSGGAEALPTATVKSSTQSAQTTENGPTAAPAHGAPQMPSGVPPGAGQPPPDTAALDKKIEQAEAKAKAAGASQADKQAASAAYLARANIFYSAGNPSLYKFALRDFRLALRYDANNAEAREKRDQIVEIYQQMGRPVPDLGNEP